MKITRYVLNNPLATGAILIGLLVLGFYGLIKMYIDFLPDITYPLIKVHIWWRGATPEEIERNIAEPVEREMATVDNLDYLESSSIEGMYTLQVNFEYGVDINVAYQDATSAMGRAMKNLPRDIEYVIIKADPSQLPVTQVVIQSSQWDLVKLRLWAENWLQDQLLAVPGVGGTEIVGGLKREIRVNLDPMFLEKYGLTLSDVINRLRKENVELFGGRVITGRHEFIARTVGEFTDIEEIKNIVVAKSENGQILMKDIAEVKDANEEVRVITRFNGKPCVKVNILKQAEANTVEVAKGVKERIEKLKPAFPPHLKLDMVENQADYIISALSGVKNTAIISAILVVLVTFLFFGTWWQVLVMMIALPITLILNFGLMKLGNFSLNIFSLGGLVIAIGVLLSNTVVVVENTTRWYTSHKSLEKRKCVLKATEEVGIPIIASTLTFLSLFVPFLLVPGLISLLFRELILVVAGVVLISLGVAVTITPLATEKLMPEISSTYKKQRIFEKIFNRILEKYGSFMKQIIYKRWAIISIFSLILILSLFLFTKLGSEFLPLMDDGRIMIKVKLPTGASVWETDKVLKQIEGIIKNDKTIESYFTLVGGKVWGLYTYEIANEGEIDIQLVPRNKRNISTKKYVEHLRPLLNKVLVPGGNVMVRQMDVKGIRKIGESDIEIKIKGPEITQLFNLASQMAKTMNERPDLINVYVSLDMTKPEFQIIPDRTKIAELGLSVDDISQYLKAFINGFVPTQYREGTEYYNIRAIIPEEKITSRSDIEKLPLLKGQNGYIRLSDVAQVIPAVGPVEIIREDQVKEVIVRADASGVSIGEALKNLRKSLEKIEIPPGYEISFGGKVQMMREMVRVIIGIIIFALLFSFIILAVQFNSFKLPGIILGCIPFTISGMIYMLFLSHLPLGAPVIIGILVVIAALANDGVLLLTFINQLEKTENLLHEESVVKAGMLRLRPIVMTTVPVIMGFIPLIFNLGGGGEMLQPMAAAAVGGLIFEIMVALILMPCLYVTFTRRKLKKENEI